MDRMKQLAVVVVFGVGACGVGSDTPADGSGSTPGHITASTTWTGTQTLDAATTIDPGVTVTVAAGTTLAIKTGVKLAVAGTLDVQGTSASKVTIGPAAGAASFGGIDISSGGQVAMTYAMMTGGSLVTTGTGKATIRDSQLSHAPGDLLIMNGGTVDVQYTAIGVEPPATDTTHCDAHFGGTGGNTITFTHSSLSTSAYGLMFYAGQAANLTYDNWFSNQTNVDVQPGVTGDFSSGYFQGAPPSGTGITVTGLASARLPACTGANDATCAGPRP